VLSSEFYGMYVKYIIDIGTQKIKVIEKNDGVCIHQPGDTLKVCMSLADVMSYVPKTEQEDEA
jgi:iron(III) transport system ATP-binding protein